MNERIKQLDQQAVDYALSVCDANGVYQGKEYLAVVKEKFAELLIKECAAEAHRRVCIVGDDNMIYANLLAHFGIEE